VGEALGTVIAGKYTLDEVIREGGPRYGHRPSRPAPAFRRPSTG
jgi:hypothetical protein